MNRLLLGFAFGCAVLAACGGKNSPDSICTLEVPPPAACNTACDPSTATDACPLGFHCSPSGKCDAQCTATGNECGDSNTCSDDGRCTGGNGCTGRACDVTDCASMGMQPTTLTGTVFAPNGTLPLYGITVYVPNSDPGPFMPGVQCGSCANGLPGDVTTQATTDEHGNFSLQGVPTGTNIPVIITTGKWRRQIKISNVGACTSTALDAADTRLPASMDDTTPNTTSIDMPNIAISTGMADSLECLVRRLGIADKEITTDKQSGHVHLFSDTMAKSGNTSGVGTSSFAAGFGGGTGTLSDSQTLWGNATDPGKLNNYDIVILSCEGAQYANTKPQEAMDHLKAYADIGGRVFLSHWHNIWVEGGTQPNTGTKPAVWPGIASFEDNMAINTGLVDTIDEVNNAKGPSFASWMLLVQKNSPMRDQITIKDNTGKHTAIAVDEKKGEQWVYYQKDAQTRLTQNFQFTTPNEGDPGARCGKVAFSDMHVSGNPTADGNKVVLPYPNECDPTPDLLDQEKALAFMFFDISSCVGQLF